jgi:hypothetical protein
MDGEGEAGLNVWTRWARGGLVGPGLALTTSPGVRRCSPALALPVAGTLSLGQGSRTEADTDTEMVSLPARTFHTF